MATNTERDVQPGAAFPQGCHARIGPGPLSGRARTSGAPRAGLRAGPDPSAEGVKDPLAGGAVREAGVVAEAAGQQPNAAIEHSLLADDQAALPGDLGEVAGDLGQGRRPPVFRRATLCL